jgi:dihydroorotase
MALDLKIVGGTVVSSRGAARLGIGVKDGRVAILAADDYLPDAAETVDAKGRYVLPGAIDAHVHIRDPGRTELEDFDTGSQAAAVGGVTTVIDMPGSDNPPLANVAAFENKLKVVTGKSYVDFALRGAVLMDNLDDIASLAEAGVVAYKILMGRSTYTPIVPDSHLFDAFRRVAATGRLLGVHAENNHLIDFLTAELQAQGRNDPLAFYESRPGYVEDEAAQRAILFAKVTGANLHIHHIGSAGAADAVREAKARGESVTGETCPHYLVLTTEDYARLGMAMRVNPSIKTPEDRDGIWRALLDGSVDTLASDHAPHSEEEKWRPSVWDALSGFPGVETLVPVMLNEVSRGRLPITRLVDATAERPARIYGIYPRKGSLEVGSEADAIVVNLDTRWTIQDRNLHSKTRVSPWDGYEVTGAVDTTIVRGMVVARDGQPVGAPRGRFVSAFG